MYNRVKDDRYTLSLVYNGIKDVRYTYSLVYNGVKDVRHTMMSRMSSLFRIDPYLLWRPDIFLYNSANDAFDATYHTNMVVSSSGKISQIPPGIFKSTCIVSFLHS